MSSRSLRDRSEGIDFLRGLFCFEVLLFAHTVFWASGAGGEAAIPHWLLLSARGIAGIFQGNFEVRPNVLGFIVLSGYCIHRSGLGPESDLTGFVIRRTLRILPVFVLATLVGIALFYRSESIDLQKAHALTGTVDIRPICIAAKLTAFVALWPIGHKCDFLGNAPLLTVTVQIGLYFAYAAIVAFRSKKVVVFSISAVSVAAGTAIDFNNLAYPVLYSWWQNSSLLAFFPYWWIGAAAVSPRVGDALRRWTPTLLILWVTLTFISDVQATAVLIELRKLALAAVVAGVIAYADEIAIPANPISWLGRASYSIYALHAPVIVWALLRGVPWWTAVGISIAVGVASFYLVERPFDRLGPTLYGASYSRSRMRVHDAVS